MTRRRSWPKLLAAVMALTATGATGAYIYRSAAVVWPAAPPAANVATAPAGAPNPAPQQAEAKSKDEGPAWSHSRLLVIRPAGADDPRPVVVLGRPTGGTIPGRAGATQKGLLARELVRQAVLLAARDELGVSTRDELLGDPMPNEPGSAAADYAWIVRLNGPASVRVGRAGAEKGVLLERDVSPSAAVHDPIGLAQAAEALSRTEFPAALRALGAEGKGNATRRDGDVPDAVERQLESFGIVEPLVAIRALHAAIGKEGESPARLGALVRGYANLGVLTEYLWAPTHKGFKARALLYAQRLIARDGNSPWGLWHRAYVEALIGLHKRALDDLAEAARLADGKDAPKAPAWVDTLDAYCHFDLARLKQAAGLQANFATFLRMLALEFPQHGDVALRAAREVLAADPECFRAHDMMYQVGGVANLHVATMFALKVLNETVPRQVRSLEALPDAVRTPAGRNAGEVALVDALERAGRPGDDAGEPSWGVLGTLIRETRFVLVQHRLYFMRHWWGVPVEEFWDESRPLVARHRFQPYLLTMAIGTPQADQAFATAFDESWLPDLELTEERMIVKLGEINERKRRRVWRIAQSRMDHLVRDFATQCDFYRKDHAELWRHNANKILMLSPEHAYAMSLLVEVDWDAVQPRLAEWGKKAADFLPLKGALARRYSELKQYDKARTLLDQYIAESPESWAYERLAHNYREQGDTAQWLATLDRYLAAGEDHGLDHARIRVEIANHYMANRQWAKAQPYAEAAAQTWAAWAIECAVRCFEGMEDWPRAELWVRRLSERYPGRSLRAWLEFCKRTGHGDIEAAKALVAQFGAPVDEPGRTAVAARPQAAGPLREGFAAWQDGNTKEAMASLRKAYEATKPVLAGCALMILADAQGDTAQRDAILDELCAKHRAKAPKFVAVLQVFRDAFARGDRDVPDPRLLERAVGNVAPNLRGNTQFVVGLLLKNRGQRKDAERYLKRCIDARPTNPWLKRIAADAVEHAEEPPERPRAAPPEPE